MFRKKQSEYKKGIPTVFYILLRSVLSITMMLIFSIGLYQAYKYFSGVDPLKIDPPTLIASLLSSEIGMDTITSILEGNLPKSLQDLGLTQKLINNDQKESGGNVNFKFAIVADSHNDNDNLTQALLQAKVLGAKFVIGLGDYSSVGSIEELQKAKYAFDQAGLPYYTTAGDHDLWEPRNKGTNPTVNFASVFGSSYQSFGYNGYRFIIVYNSDNYEGIDELQMLWLDDQFTKITIDGPKASFLFMHEPLYHPSSDHVMGKTNPNLKDQAAKVAQRAREAGMSEVFSGDTHFFTRFTDPKSLLSMTTVGAITTERNVQKSRFVMVDVYDSGEYNVIDVEIK